MKRFPRPVREAMAANGAAATCVPVQLDGEDWEAALFVSLGGAESKEDRRLLRKAGGTVPLGFELDLIETESGAVVVIRPEIHARPGDPMVFEVLLTPGEGHLHFQALKLLTKQPRLSWFFGDNAHWLLHAQSHALGAEQHAGFESLLKDALRHDTMVRVTQRYDALAALSEVVRHYELRAGANAVASNLGNGAPS